VHIGNSLGGFLHDRSDARIRLIAQGRFSRQRPLQLHTRLLERGELLFQQQSVLQCLRRRRFGSGVRSSGFAYLLVGICAVGKERVLDVLKRNGP
jgi:hypothetical protein